MRKGGEGTRGLSLGSCPYLQRVGSLDMGNILYFSQHHVCHVGDAQSKVTAAIGVCALGTAPSTLVLI